MAGLVIGLVLAASACASAPAPEPHAPESCREWPLWSAYKKGFIEADGRVVDRFAHHSTSEGQAYAMFLALVARDRATFTAVLGWTQQHLAKGDLGGALPAWKWQESKGKSGTTGAVVDAHAASDADLFMAYTLVHAAVVFGDDALATIGGKLLGRIAAREVAQLPGLGPMLLPGSYGFDTHPGFWRVNPSYQPVPLLRWAARVDPDGPWAAVLDNAVRLAEEATPERLYPDWAAWSPVARRFVSDPDSGASGSYDAIRAYLWPALMAPEDALRGRLLARGSRLLEAARVNGSVPEVVDAFDGAKAAALIGGAPKPGPVGFQAVGQVFALALGDAATATVLAARVAAERRDDGLYGEPAFYYDQNLVLFAQGFLERRFRFQADGSLELLGDEGGCGTR